MSEEIKKEVQDVELNPEELDKVAGGAIFCCGVDRDRPWEVISDVDGRVIGRFAAKEDAVKFARNLGIEEKELTWAEIIELRRR